MKRFIYLTLSLVILTAAGSAVEGSLIYSNAWKENEGFWGQDAGGIASAQVKIKIYEQNPSLYKLFLELENTSPKLLMDGSGPNSPGIVSFGFSLLNNPTLSSNKDWTLTAFDSGGTEVDLRDDTNFPKNKKKNYDPYSLSIAEDTGYSLFNFTLNSPDVKYSLFNPDAEDGFPGGDKTPHYFTTASLTMFFEQMPALEYIEGYTPFLKMQNVGLDGEGSVKLAAVPEPATMLLLGTGLLGLAGLGRKKLLKKGRQNIK